MFGMQMMSMIAGILLFVGTAQAGTLTITASFYPAYIIAKNITKDVPGVTAQNLASVVTGCLHDYAVSSRDMEKLANTQVFVVNGAGMESFLDKVIAAYPHLTIVRLSEGIPLLENNPHVWVSVSDAVIQAKNLGKAMQAWDPLHADLYGKNTEIYVSKLQALRQQVHAALAPYKGKKIVTFHEAFAYFAREFGLEVASVVEREPGSQPSAKELAEAISLIKKEGISAIFSEPQYPAAAAQAIARETGAVVYVLDPAVTGPDDDDAYIHIMENNLTVLVTALRG